MANPYTVLEVAVDADDETIRRSYLELVRRFPPEQYPERFAAVRAAYENVKDINARAAFRLFEAGRDDTIDAIIEEAACRTPQRRIGLRMLLKAAFPPSG
jgi:curved DNA-binding protein CbpA